MLLSAVSVLLINSLDIVNEHACLLGNSGSGASILKIVRYTCFTSMQNG